LSLEKSLFLFLLYSCLNISLTRLLLIFFYIN
jgi:hypothetical protein